MQEKKTQHGEKLSAQGDAAAIPAPDAFRPWLEKSLLLLELAPSSYGVALGLGKNSLRYFLSGEGKDLRLGTASRVFEDLSRRARAKNLELPPLQIAEIAEAAHG